MSREDERALANGVLACEQQSPVAQSSWCCCTFQRTTSASLSLQLYGAYYRQLSKKVQTELAEANSVAEVGGWVGKGVGTACPHQGLLCRRRPGDTCSHCPCSARCGPACLAANRQGCDMARCGKSSANAHYTAALSVRLYPVAAGGPQFNDHRQVARSGGQHAGSLRRKAAPLLQAAAKASHMHRMWGPRSAVQGAAPAMTRTAVRPRCFQGRTCMHVWGSSQMSIGK